MESQAFASIDLSWDTLRYAEAAHEAGGVRPLRLGNCDFDFDVGRELLHEEPPTRLNVVAEALNDVFAGARSTQLRVVVHPPSAHAFVTVVPADLPAPERKARFRQEAGLLAGPESADALHVTAAPIHADTHLDVEPVHVLAVPHDRHARFEQVTAALPHADVQWMLSTQAAARVMTHGAAAAPASTAEPAFGLVVGVYPGYTEYGLVRNGHWYYSHYAEAEEPVDAAYFATALFAQLDIPRTAVTAIGLYGLGANAEAFAPFETVFDVAPQPLDPFAVLGLDEAATQNAAFGAGAYAPCIGATL